MQTLESANLNRYTICLSLKSLWNLWILLALGLTLVTPVQAHTIKVAEDVAATFHLEPDHNPRAGQPAKVWFALTRKGGTVIPLDQCECKLAIYPSTQKQGEPILQPKLTAIDAEHYHGIPSAEVIFPEVGSYRLELSGTPKPGTDFKAFLLTYEVGVSR